MIVVDKFNIEKLSARVYQLENVAAPVTAHGHKNHRTSCAVVLFYR